MHTGCPLPADMSDLDTAALLERRQQGNNSGLDELYSACGLTNALQDVAGRHLHDFQPAPEQCPIARRQARKDRVSHFQLAGDGHVSVPQTTGSTHISLPDVAERSLPVTSIYRARGGVARIEKHL